MKIVLAFDSFKGSLSAEEAVEAARQGVLSACPDAEAVGFPLADGGEGTTAALCRFMKAEWTECKVRDPLFREIKAKYAVCDVDVDFDKKEKTAIMEMASAAGLPLLEEGERNPMQTSTFGVGEMILDAIHRGCTHILIGIGGSATNDCGMGMLAALGVRFLDENGEDLLPVGKNLSQIKSIDWTRLSDLGSVTIDVACDVRNPLYGKDGAAFVYAPQKGASLSETEQLDEGLRNFASLCHAKKEPLRCPENIDRLENIPGSGAAGGLGFALLLLGANICNGTDLILSALDFDHCLENADLVITGEGKIDRQTLNGKLPFGVLQHAKRLNIPTIAFAGMVDDTAALLQSGFHSVHSINPPGLKMEDAMKAEIAKNNLKQKVYELTRTLFAD